MEQQQAEAMFYREIWPFLPAVLRAAQFLTRNIAEAEDLAQETMLKAFKSIDRFKPGTDMKAWLMTILRNTRIDALRSARRPATLSLDDVGDVAEPAMVPAQQAWQHPQEVLQAFSDEQVIEALKRLPEEIRWTLMLVDVEQMDHAEAANVLDVPVGTIKSRAHRGRAMLRQLLEPLAEELRLVSGKDRLNLGNP